MLDPAYFGDRLADLEKALKSRQADIASLDEITLLSKKRKELIQQVEALKSERNRVSQEVAKLKAESKKDPNLAERAEEKVQASKQLGDRIHSLDRDLAEAEASLKALALTIPNIPDSSVPVGKDSSSNVEVRAWGKIRAFSFSPKDHVEIGERLGILDFEAAGKIAGARFSVYLGAGAALERALIQFMLDLHTREHGYLEVIPPFLVNRDTMTGTGQLPKFEGDSFKTMIGDKDFFLIPTSEVSLTNYYRESILPPGKLPVHFTAYSPCFRSEAGSYGKDVRGLIRQHQFQKVELVKFCEPEKSMEELESMVRDAERVLQLLELPYRVMALCTGDMGFQSTKTYDLEVWLPSQNHYREISSCSNCGDFQSRRAGIRYRPGPNDKPRLAHTLNGSGLAVGRTFLAILENFQREDGSVVVPRALHPYLDGKPGFARSGEDLLILPA